MQFAESQIYGRTGKRCIACLRDFACKRRSKIQKRDAFFLKLFLGLLKSGEPRTVSLEQDRSVVMITDACYERDSRQLVCGLGGVMVGEAKGLKFFFSCELNEDQRNMLGELNKKQIIFEAETLCAVLAYCLWTSFFTDRTCFLYVDYEAVAGSWRGPVLRTTWAGALDQPCRWRCLEEFEEPALRGETPGIV
eukprot:s1035_g13.t1